MDPIPWPDKHYLHAAEGWLELGNAVEARLELAQIAKPLQTHPAVLDLRWQVSAAAKDWPNCLDLAVLMTGKAPENPVGWIHRSYTLHELGRTQEAWDNLFGVASQFPKHPTIAYNLACYSCRLGDLQRAREWLDRAFALDQTSELRRAAADDPDLAPLRPPGPRDS